MQDAVKQKRPFLSVVVPVYNEVENIRILYGAIRDVLNSLAKPCEILMVDDGSTDGTREILRELAGSDPDLRVILFRKNFGQSAAMGAGFRASRGEWVVAMDGDLQNDPKDIPRLIQKIHEGYDVVSGWRKNRKDGLVIRKIPSRIANKLICSVTDVRLHDTGCSLKIFRRDVIDRIRLYGELHRFIPALARVEGARIAEMVVAHHPRRFGESKYNITRTFRVLMDLSSLNLFIKYLGNPLRFFGRIGLAILFFTALCIAWAGWLALSQHWQAAELNVLITLIFLQGATGFQFVFYGLIASLIVKTGSRKGRTLSAQMAFRQEERYE